MLKKKKLIHFAAVVVTALGCLSIFPFSANAAQNTNNPQKNEPAASLAGYYGINNKGKNTFGIIGNYDNFSGQSKTEGCYYTGHHSNGTNDFGVIGSYTQDKNV